MVVVVGLYYHHSLSFFLLCAFAQARIQILNLNTSNDQQQQSPTKIIDQTTSIHPSIFTKVVSKTRIPLPSIIMTSANFVQRNRQLCDDGYYFQQPTDIERLQPSPYLLVSNGEHRQQKQHATEAHVQIQEEGQQEHQQEQLSQSQLHHHHQDSERAVQSLNDAMDSILYDTNTIRELSALRITTQVDQTNMNNIQHCYGSNINNGKNAQNEETDAASIAMQTKSQLKNIDSILSSLEQKLDSLSVVIKEEKDALKRLYDTKCVAEEQFGIIQDIFDVCLNTPRGENDTNTNGSKGDGNAEQLIGYSLPGIDDYLLMKEEQQREGYCNVEIEERNQGNKLNLDERNEGSIPINTMDAMSTYSRHCYDYGNNNSSATNDNSNSTDVAVSGQEEENAVGTFITQNEKLRDLTNKWRLNKMQRQQQEQEQQHYHCKSKEAVASAKRRFHTPSNAAVPTITKRDSSIKQNEVQTKLCTNKKEATAKLSRQRRRQSRSQTVAVELEPVTRTEFENVSKNIRGRITLSTLNAALEDIKSSIQQKYNTLSSSHSSSSRYRETLTTHQYYLSSTNLSSMSSSTILATKCTEEISNPLFISEQELRNDCLFFRKGESTARAILLVLRSVKRIKQVVGKKSQALIVIV